MSTVMTILLGKATPRIATLADQALHTALYSCDYTAPWTLIEQTQKGLAQQVILSFPGPHHVWNHEMQPPSSLQHLCTVCCLKKATDSTGAMHLQGLAASVRPSGF